MGLRSWPPSTEPSMMACLHVETPPICKFKSALQFFLQHRRSGEQLVEQGIMPPLKAPTAFHERIRNLDRARTGNLLKHKLCRRPARSELIHMHILQESQADASVQATQQKLKRARLADDLNQKIAHRPGPMELVEKNILPVEDVVKKDHDGDSPDKTGDVYTFTEGKCEALSPRTCHQTSPSTDSVSPAPTEDASLSSSSSSVQPSPSHASSDVSSTSEKPAASSQPITVALTKTPQQSSPKPAGEKSRSKKSREAKPRIRKLKYHQYIPPDQHKHELKPSPAARVDAAYVRILQQQQHFLQLQILSQQQALFNSTGGFQSGSSAKFPNESGKPEQLPANVDEMKVAELKVELKLRSLPVSGTKMDLIERLKLYHESLVTNVETKAPEDTPPPSPKVSNVGPEDNSGDGPTAPSPRESDSREKDRRLREKERQIEELKRRLEREQKLVEELKLQLEVEKRSQQMGEASPAALEEGRVEIKREEDMESNISTPPLAKGDDSAPLSKTWTGPRIDPFPSIVTKTAASEPVHRGHPPAFTPQPPPSFKCKILREPPRYEDAVKHMRMLPAIQGLCAASQQMDDLFDILIESGEMSPFLKAELSDANNRAAVTPSVTLLPVNTVLSRPPPRVQVAHTPAEELPLHPVAMETEPGDDVDDLHDMDWLDLSVSAAEGVFSADFLDTYQLF